MRVFLKALICLIALQSQAFEFSSLPGWTTDGNFYPVTNAAPRYYGTNWMFTKDVWAVDLENAWEERGAYVGAVVTNDIASVVRWEHQSVASLKAYAYEVVQGYVCLTNRATNGTYDAWYEAQPSITNYSSFAEYRDAIVHPPSWNATNVLEYVGLPTNFWAYTPARWLGGKVPPITNANTQAGFDTRHYGWHGLVELLKACEDVIGSPVHITHQSGITNEYREQPGSAERVLEICESPQPNAITNSIFVGSPTASVRYNGAYAWSDNCSVMIAVNVSSESEYQYGFDGESHQMGTEFNVEIRTDYVFQVYDFVWDFTYQTIFEELPSSTYITNEWTGYSMRFNDKLDTDDSQIGYYATPFIGERIVANKLGCGDLFATFETWEWLNEVYEGECGSPWNGYESLLGTGLESQRSLAQSPVYIFRPDFVYKPEDVHP
jgi:hypothetical protein